MIHISKKLKDIGHGLDCLGTLGIRKLYSKNEFVGVCGDLHSAFMDLRIYVVIAHLSRI